MTQCVLDASTAVDATAYNAAYAALAIAGLANLRVLLVQS